MGEKLVFALAKKDSIENETVMLFIGLVFRLLCFRQQYPQTAFQRQALNNSRPAKCYLRSYFTLGVLALR